MALTPPPPCFAWSPSPASQGRIDGCVRATLILPRLRGRGTTEGGGGGVLGLHAKFLLAAETT